MVTIKHKRRNELEMFSVRKYLEPVLFRTVLLGILAFAAFPYLEARKAAAPMIPSTISDKRYSTDMKELQTRFNRDKGKVRLLLLLSPS